MVEYIRRDGLLRKFNIDDMMNVNGTLISLHDARETISNFPAADVAPVRHGKWVHSRYENCSEQFEMVRENVFTFKELQFECAMKDHAIIPNDWQEGAFV